MGETPVGYRSPAGDFSENFFEILSRNGVISDSRLKDNDFPDSLDEENRIVELPDTWYLDDFLYFEFNTYPWIPYQSEITSNAPVFDTWLREFRGLHKCGRLFNLSITRNSSVQAVLMPSRRRHTWITTYDEVAEYWHRDNMN